MKLNYLTSIYSDTSTIKDLADIISEIRNGDHLSVIGKVRAIADKTKRNRFKERNLKAFIIGSKWEEGINSFGNSTNPSSTGIVQLDIDDYSDKEKSLSLIKKLKKNPHVLFAFLSPSNGVKFGVRTDFHCSGDKSTIKRKYGYGYEIVKEVFSDLLKDVMVVDPSTEKVSQPCFVSFDPDAYHNPSCEVLAINDRIELRQNIQDEIDKEKGKIDPSVFKTIEGKEVKKCLACIDDELDYGDRLKINFAVIDYFGVKAKAILMNHWDVEDSEKLSRNLDSQIDSHINGNHPRKRTIGTLFDEGKKYGYQSQPIVNTDKPPTWNPEGKYYTPEQCSKELQKIILHNFFGQKKDQAVIVECGAGKTTSLYKAISIFLLKKENIGKKIAIFFKTHEGMDQFNKNMNGDIDKINKNIDEVNASISKVNNLLEKHHKNLGQISGRKTIHPHQRPANYTGLGKHCTKYDSDTITSGGSLLCGSCLLQYNGCSYYEQFENTENSVRVFPYNRLFVKSKAEKDDFKADYIIIEEDFVPISTSDTMLEVKEENSEYDSVTKILMELKKGKSLAESLTGDSRDLLVKDSRLIDKKISDLKVFNIINPKRLDPKKLKGYQAIFAKKTALKRHQKMIKELIKLTPEGNKWQSKKLWLENKKENEGTLRNQFKKDSEGKEWLRYKKDNENNPRLIWGEMRKIHSDFKKTPILYLDGSGSEEVIKSVMKRPFKFHHLSVPQYENAKVYQFTGADSSFSKAFFSRDKNRVNLICNWIDTLEIAGRRLGLIRYKRINGDDDFFHLLDEKVAKINSRKKAVKSWFGAIRGLNKFENLDTLLVVGSHRIPDYSVYNLAQLIFREDVFKKGGDKSKIVTEDYWEYAKREKIDKVYRLKKGPNKLVRQSDYHGHCKMVSDHIEKAENYQSVHRARLLHKPTEGPVNKTVYILSDTVLDVSLDGILDRYKELSDLTDIDYNIQILKHLKSKKFLIDTKEEFVKIFGWDIEAIKRVRDKRISGEWLKSHRSLKFWTFKSTEKIDGNYKFEVYSWHDRTKAQAEKWLNGQGITVKEDTLKISSK